MSDRKVGLFNALDPTRGDSPAQSGDSATSGVASLASRFTQSNTTGEKDTVKLSEKMSDLAGRFGSTVDKDSSKPLLSSGTRGGKYRAAAAAAKASKAAEENARVVAELPGKVGDVAKKFAQSKEAPSTDHHHHHDDTPAFASAADHFRRAEQDQLRPAESRVSAFAKRIESGATATFDSPAGVERKVAGVARSFESKSVGQPPRPERTKASSSASSIGAAAPARSRYDTVMEKDKDMDKQKQRPIREGGPASTSLIEEEEKGQFESSESRFANATKLFESGRANPERQLNAASSSDNASAEDEQSSAQSRFADAARVFGGA